MDSQSQIVDSFQLAIRDVQLAPRSHQQISNIIGLGLNEAVAVLYPEATRDQLSDLADAYRFHFLAPNKGHSPMFDGALDVLKQLREQGYWLAVATGKSRRGLNRILQDLELESWFAVTRCADETFSKPHPRMLEEILTDLDSHASRALMVGDTEYDLQMAKNIGMDALGVSYGVHEVERLHALNPVGMIDGIQELPRWLQQTISAT